MLDESLRFEPSGINECQCMFNNFQNQFFHFQINSDLSNNNNFVEIDESYFPSIFNNETKNFEHVKQESNWNFNDINFEEKNGDEVIKTVDFTIRNDETIRITFKDVSNNENSTNYYHHNNNNACNKFNNNKGRRCYNYYNKKFRKPNNYKS